MSLKLVKGDHIRKVGSLPQSLADLQTILVNLYGSSNYSLLYVDDDSEILSITGDAELQRAYSLSKGKPSVRILVKEFGEDSSELLSRIDNIRESIALYQTMPLPPRKEMTSEPSIKQQEIPQKIEKLRVSENLKSPTDQRVVEEAKKLEERPKINNSENKVEFCPSKCSVCSVPLSGDRFICLMYDFMLCENCEKTNSHPHPLVKVKDGQDLPQLNAVYMYKAKIKVVNCPRVAHLSEGTAAIWKIKNEGSLVWPENSKFEVVQGDLGADSIALPRIQPGESVKLTVNVKSNSEGEKTAKWGVNINGAKIARKKLRVCFVDIPRQYVSRVNTLVSIGIPATEALSLLRQHNWDLLLSLSNIMS